MTGGAAAQGQYFTDTKGVDVSWANCGTRLPVDKSTDNKFGIVDVSDGTGYSTNPCLTQQARRFANLSLYVNTGWNNQSAFINPAGPKACKAGDNNCLAYNYGYNAGVYAYNAAAKGGVRSPTWWLDVETVNTWNSDVAQNRNSLQGEYDALASRGVWTIGVYSTTAQWQTITGGWQNNLPSWGATTWTTAYEAEKYCVGHQFTGGPSYLMQYLPANSPFDHDVAC